MSELVQSTPSKVYANPELAEQTACSMGKEGNILRGCHFEDAEDSTTIVSLLKKKGMVFKLVIQVMFQDEPTAGV